MVGGRGLAELVLRPGEGEVGNFGLSILNCTAVFYIIIIQPKMLTIRWNMYLL